MTTDAISALGAGSGVDVKALATSLVDAERVPRKAAIDAKITKAEGGISGYSAIKYVLNDLKTAFLNLKDQSDFNSASPRISQPNSVAVSAGSATTGIHSINVQSLATAQRRLSIGFATGNVHLNGNTAITLDFKIHGTAVPPITVPADADTPGGIVLAINSANIGITAQLINTGETSNPFKIMLTGTTGETQDFTLTSSVSGLGFGTPLQSDTGYVAGSSLNSGTAFDLNFTKNGVSQNIAVGTDTPEGIVAAINASNTGVNATGLSASLIPTGDAAKPYRISIQGGDSDFALTSPVSGMRFSASLQQAANAVVNVDGMNVRPSSNKLENLIPGATIDLLAPTTGNASIEITRDTSSVKTKLQALVTSYNDAVSMLKVLGDPKSAVPDYGGKLAGNSILNTVQSTIRDMLASNSNSPSGGMVALRDMGISIDKAGVMNIDETKLNTTLSTKFDQVVTVLSANRENLSTFNGMTAGIAGEAVKKLTTLLDKNGFLETQSTTLETRIKDYKAELLKLEARMTQLQERYNKQFSSMENIVGQSKSLKTSLTSTFDGMMSVYTNK